MKANRTQALKPLLMTVHRHQQFTRFAIFLVISHCLAPRSLIAVESSSFDPALFDKTIRPMVKEYCLGCHSTEKHKGDVDFEHVTTLSELMKHPKVWQTAVEQLLLGEMPPRDKPQPTPADRERLVNSIEVVLDEAAKARAGDPGPVVLRRLNNTEYTFTVRDLTGVDSLNPAREFPGDSAAGEGFMNTGNSLVMSPALITKYLAAGKEIAAHAVLLPDGIRFSPATTRRDWTDETLAQIRSFYRQFTDPRGGDKVNLQGIVFDTNEGGRLPLEKYLSATLELRVRSEAKEGSSSASDIGSARQTLARERGLNARYLGTLWETLNSREPSLVLDPIRARWRSSAPADSASLAVDIANWQKVLWKFSSVGHIGKIGGPKAWMEPVNPLISKLEVRLKLAAPTNGNNVFLYLNANDAGDGNAGDYVVWQQPRLVLTGRPDLALRDVREFLREMEARRDKISASVVRCLEAAAEVGAATGQTDIAGLARRHDVDAEVLTAWFEYLGITSTATQPLDYFKNQLKKASNHDFVNGWGTTDTPSLYANSSDQAVRIPGNMKAHGVTLHPSPKLNAAVGWRSPISARMRVEAAVTHAHPECGNGVVWSLELRRGTQRQRLASGTAQGGKGIKISPIENLAVRTGDLISLLIGPRDGNHSCDLTDVELVLKSTAADGPEWSLTRDVSPDVLAGNPHADRFGTAGIWHFYTEPVSGHDAGPSIPVGSLLSNWQSAEGAADRQKFATAVQALIRRDAPSPKDGPDAVLHRQLTSLGGPLLAGAQNVAVRERIRSAPSTKTPANAASPEPGTAPPDISKWGLEPGQFGRHPNGSNLDPTSLCLQAPSLIEIPLPADLVAGAEFVTTGLLEDGTGSEGSVQLQVLTAKPESPSRLQPGTATVKGDGGSWTSQKNQLAHSAPIIVRDGSAARRRIESNFDDFRAPFPAALCYTKIVPVDEVVTLTLLHREDYALSRLMLDDAQKAALDRMWNELHYVSQDALTLVDAFAQLMEYATQDGDPKVFEPLRKPIQERATALRRELITTEPKHLESLLTFAENAYRRPLLVSESQELRELYKKLREQEIPHDESIRLTLARVFVSPAFLYRLERTIPGRESTPVSDWELASRLSYFLWSSQPDATLRDLAAAGKLRDPEVLASHARQMLRDDRVRRLATEFACQWLHIHDFDQLDEKSERHFPTFAGLRGALYEEPIQFFTDLFRGDGSLLTIFDADHTFLNESLAGHYGIPGVTGPEWRRVDGVKKYSRGGILAFGATLAKQSGASRTSPILRGNWVAEALLGDKLPRPPKDVPRLPEDEATESLSVRQLVQKHTNDPKCAGCHRRIDGYGFVLEGFDAIGRARVKDLADRPVETQGIALDGSTIEGIDGLRDYLLNKKRSVVLRQFCRKLLGYSLGRGVQLSDNPLLSEMQRQLAMNGYPFSSAVETIVRSRQFREIRGRDAAFED